MSLNAVETYVAAQLAGLTSALLDPAESWILPPPVTYMTTPQIYVWGGTADEDRHTNPRGSTGGQKRAIWQISVWLQVATTSDSTGVGGPEAFPVFIDAVMACLRSLPIPQHITDPVTGATSTVQTIGERMKLDHPTPMAANDQSVLLWHAAGIRVWLTEEFDA